MFLNFWISIAIIVPCLSVPQGYRPPSAGVLGNGFGGFSEKGSSSSGGFGLSLEDDSGGFNGIKGHGGGGQGFNEGFSGEHGVGGPGFSGGHGGVQGGFDGGKYGGHGGVQGGIDGGKYGRPVIPILKDNREGPIDGHYRFEFETGNGISRQEEGAPNGPYGAVTQQGGWTFTFPDGTPAEFSFVADENGYRVESPLLPTPPPLPPHAIAQIEKAAKEGELGLQEGYSSGGQDFGGVPKGVGGFHGSDDLVSQQGFQGSSQEFQGQHEFDSGRQAFQGHGQGSSKQYSY
ncbi:UNVERIFIED_CONTAM: hypothetical protein RMT77_014457 [Armadillidium vulgare]